MKKTVAVIGGGAAGLMASYQAGAKGAKVFLFERNRNLGRKILISGKGRCNLTNIKDIEEFITSFSPHGKFLYSSLMQFSNLQLINFFERRGLKTKVERGGRVFPESDRSQDIVRVLKEAALEAGVYIKYNTRVKELIVKEQKVVGIRFYDTDDVFYCDKVIVATGGLSYPATGSTGDGFELARQVGHKITPLRPALVPLIAKEPWIKELQGLSLKNVELSMILEGKKISKEFGEMLFTHYGISGPIVLTLSRDIVDLIGNKTLIASIDLKPALDEKKLDERLLRDFTKNKNKIFKNALGDLLPKTLIPVFVNYCNVDPEKDVNQISRVERKRILNSLKDFRITIVGCRKHEAIVTKGGISLREISPTTMESKIIKGLYFAGEVLDVDGVTGGYNLQAAFSTGFLAGMSAAKED